MKTPDISFVIPAFNSQFHLSDCLISCLNQSHKNIEVVVVDDGSTDSTRRLIEHFSKADKRVTGVLLPQNTGRGHARNIGNETARAPIIAVLDSDDMADRDRAKNTLELMDQCVLYGAAVVVDSVGNPYAKLRAEPFDLQEAIKKQVNMIVHSTMAYPRGIINLAKYDEGEYGTVGLDDWKFQIDLALAGVVFKHTEKVLSSWRENQGQVMQIRDIERVKTLKGQYFEKYAIK